MLSLAVSLAIDPAMGPSSFFISAKQSLNSYEAIVDENDDSIEYEILLPSYDTSFCCNIQRSLFLLPAITIAAYVLRR